jgi:hypothetical protein
MLEPSSDDDIKVEIIWPQEYVDYSHRTMRKYSSAIALLCKASAVLGEDDTEFIIYGMTLTQVQVIEEVMKMFGIELVHIDHKVKINGKTSTWFFADISGLRELMDNEY